MSTRFLKLCKPYKEIIVLKKKWDGSFHPHPHHLFFLRLARKCFLALYIQVYIKEVKCYTYMSSISLSFCFKIHGKISFLPAVSSVSPGLCLRSAAWFHAVCLPLKGRFLSLFLLSDLSSKPPWEHEQNPKWKWKRQKDPEIIFQLSSQKGQNSWGGGVCVEWIHFKVNVWMSENWNVIRALLWAMLVFRFCFLIFSCLWCNELYYFLTWWWDINHNVELILAHIPAGSYC